MPSGVAFFITVNLIRRFNMYFRTEVALALSKKGVEVMHRLMSGNEDFYVLLGKALHKVHGDSGTEIWYWDSSMWFNEDIMPFIDSILRNLDNRDYKFVWIDADLKGFTDIGILNMPYRLRISYTIAIEKGEGMDANPLVF